MVRCKFTCTTKTLNEDGTATIGMMPVYSGSDENKKFFNYTPWGSIGFGTINKEAAKQFEVGKEYYVDFTPAFSPAETYAPGTQNCECDMPCCEQAATV